MLRAEDSGDSAISLVPPASPFEPSGRYRSTSMTILQVDNRSSSRSGLLGNDRDAAQEERKPALTIPALTDCHEAVVVLRPVPLQVIAHIEQRSVQHTSVNQQAGDKEAAIASVAIEERLDRLKLCVRYAAVN
jgi:hypothetical protein